VNEIVVVGASLAGIRAVEELRRRGFAGSVTVIGAEPHLPYDRPPLSKAVISEARSPHEFPVRRGGDYESLGAELRLGVTAVGLDLGERVVALDDGTTVRFDGLIIATGSRPRQLALDGSELAGVHTLRTADDALAIAAAVRGGARVAIVGAGFIGCEVASSVRAAGGEVTLIETLTRPLQRALAPELGTIVAGLVRDHGVDLRCNVAVTGFIGADRVAGVALADGTTVDAELAIIGIGVVPETSWLEGSGIELDDGVLCDATLAVAGEPGVYAAGDVARAPHPLIGGRVRSEHWTDAAQQGAAAAANLLTSAAAEPYREVPYVWSDQFGVKLQLAGFADPDDDVTIFAGEPSQRRFAAVMTRGDRVVGVFGMNRAPIVMRARALIGAGASRRDVLALAG
jgi:NADPH-dependent 2,4-dienoyl-CoA reductase/sulfur reductase-like enzyme